MASKEEEQIKLTATFVNNLGVTFVGAGFVAPAVAAFTSSSWSANAATFVVTGIAALILGIALHYAALLVLKDLEQ